MKFAFLWTQSSGYFEACVRQLSEMPGAELLVIVEPAQSSAPYRPTLLAHIRWVERGSMSDDETRLMVQAFSPEVLLVSSWHIPLYRRIAKERRGHSRRVLCMDNPWRATFKQVAGVAGSRRYVLPLFDYAWVTGERQAEFAKRLGFRDSQLLYGLYAIDLAAYQQCPPLLARPEAFLFTGRLAPAKGISQLVAAYALYRAKVHEPWPLLVAGAGPLSSTLNATGVSWRGFVQPESLPSFLAEGQAFVFPSVYEHWGVSLHEAAAAGLPLVTSRAVGAAVHLCQDAHNGLLIDPFDTISFARALGQLAADPPARVRMGLESALLARQFSSDRWCGTLLALLDTRGQE